jgi:hypothetical protein
MSSILQVAFVSQLGLGADSHNNDCGAAGSLMLLKTYGLAKEVTVDQFFDLVEPAGDNGLYVDSMQAAMEKYGLRNQWKIGLNRGDIFTTLSQYKPILSLIHYAPLVDAKVTQFTGFRGPHFVVITGIDLDYIYIHDPDRNDGKVNVQIPIMAYEEAMAQAYLDGNPTGGGIIPLLPIQQIPVPPSPTGTPYVMAVVNGVQIQGINVRALPTSNSTLVKTLWRKVNPVTVVYIVAISADQLWGRLLDNSGWVYMPYLKAVV